MSLSVGRGLELSSPSVAVDGEGRLREGGSWLRRLLAGTGSEEEVASRSAEELRGGLGVSFNEWLGELSCDDIDGSDGDWGKAGLGSLLDAGTWVGAGSDGPTVTFAKADDGSGFFDTRLDNRSTCRDWLLDGGFRDTSVD